MSQILTSKLSDVRGRLGVISAIAGVGIAISALFILFAAGMFFDWWLEFPWLLRAALLAIDLSILAFIVFRYIVEPLLFGPDDDELALMVERQTPSFQTRLIASIQFSRPEAIPVGASTALIRAMVSQTEQIAHPLNFAGVVKSDELRKNWMWALGIIGAGIVLFALTREVSSELLKRVLLGTNPVPRATAVECLTFDKTIAQGDGVVIDAKAWRVTPKSGRMEVKYASGRTVEFTMDRMREIPSDLKEKFLSNQIGYTRSVENVQDSFRYRVIVNDAHTEWYKVNTLPRPAVNMVACTQLFPEYVYKEKVRRLTAAKQAAVEAAAASEKKALGEDFDRRIAAARQQTHTTGDLSLLAGSHLKIQVKANQPIRHGELHLAGLDVDQPLDVDKADAKLLNGELAIPADKLKGFSVHLTDSHDIESRADTLYRVDVVPDKAPVVKITWPDSRGDLLVTSRTRMLIRYEATDDYGVAGAVLHYKCDKLDNNNEKIVEMSPSGLGEQTLKQSFEWNLNSVSPPLPEDSTLEFWIEVKDSNNVSCPPLKDASGAVMKDAKNNPILDGSRGVSEHLNAKVVPKEVLDKALADKLGEALDRISELQRGQENINDATVGFLLGRSPTTKPADKKP